MSPRRVTEAELGRILTIISARPNSRRRRRPGDLDGPFEQWFDGGAVRVEEGATIYEMGDGTRVTAAGAPALSLTIRFRDGIVVTVEQRGA